MVKLESHSFDSDFKIHFHIDLTAYRLTARRKFMERVYRALLFSGLRSRFNMRDTDVGVHLCVELVEDERSRIIDLLRKEFREVADAHPTPRLRREG